jgi:hypothetical protein
MRGPLKMSRPKHGMTDTPTHKSWVAMRTRCLKPYAKSYKNYGGRGVKVCERWRYSFEAFLADMGPRPGPEYSLDRIDNDGNYEPSNCRWATMTQQASNRRGITWIVIDEVRRPLAEWSRISGIRRKTIWTRIRLGWPPREAVFAPSMHCHSETVRRRQATVAARCAK